MLTTDNVIFSALIAAVIFYQISMIVKYFHRKQNKNHKIPFIYKIKKDLETALNKLLDLDYAKTKNN